MFTRKMSLLAAIMAILVAAQVSGGTIVQDTFTGVDDTSLTDHTPDRNLPEGAWGSNGNVSAWGDPIIEGNAVFVNPDMGTGILLASMGSYTKPTLVTISVDMTLSTLDTSSVGTGLGFYNYVAPWQTWGIQNFTGLLLRRDGTLEYVSNNGTTTTVLQSVAWSGIGGASYVSGATHTLSYSLDTATGRIASVSLSGSNADFSAIIGDTSSTLTDNATTMAGFVVAGYATGVFDNFTVAAVNSVGYEVDALASYGNGVNFTQSTIDAALAAIGTTNKATLLLRPGAWAINANADWSAYANVTFKIVPGATLQVATGVTVTLPNLDETGLHQQFACVGTGTVVGVKEPRPEWWGAYHDGTHATETTAAIRAAQAGSINGKLRLTKGTYLVARAINLSNNWIIEGTGRNTTIIQRTDTTAETLDGVSTTTVLYISGTWVSVRDLTITGAVATINGISFSNAGANSHVNLDRLDINFCKTAITETQGLFMTTFNNINVAQCENAFSFISANGKTSLTFNSCYASSVGQAWDFRNTVYSVLNSCGSDYANWQGISPNPSGTGYGNPATAKGVYHFYTSSVVMNGCGAEASYGNGIVGVEIGSNITINNLTSYSCRSTFVPDYATYPNYAVGPIQTGTSACGLFITGLQVLDWHNTVVDSTYPTKPIAGMVAFNYDDAVGGAQATKMVVVGGASGASSGTFAGNGPWRRYCLTTYDLGNVIKGETKTITAPMVVTGTGTKILIPIQPQTVLNRKHYIKITGLNGTSNGVTPLVFQGECSFVSLNSGPINFTTWNLKNVTAIARNAANTGVEVTLSASRTNPMIMLEILSEQPSLIDIEHLTIN